VQFVMQRYTPKKKTSRNTQIVLQESIFNCCDAQSICKQAKQSSLGTKNPLIIHEHVQFDQKVIVWCGICSEKIIRPYFFENNDGKAVSISGRYRAMLNEFLAPQVLELVWKACISNRMALHAIHRLPQSFLCVKCFLDASYRNLTISFGHRGRPIWHHQIFFVGLLQK